MIEKAQFSRSLCSSPDGKSRSQAVPLFPPFPLFPPGCHLVFHLVLPEALQYSRGGLVPTHEISDNFAQLIIDVPQKCGDAIRPLH
jgi:hypothetical protein